MRAVSSAAARARARQHGFTLVEIAVVMAIVALLLGSVMVTYSARMEQQNRTETQRLLDEARELLLAFAVVNGRLPCPATAASNGDEAPSGGGACTSSYGGFLPGRAIGFRPTDSAGFAIDVWGNRIRYAVSATTWSGTGRFTTSHVTSPWSVSQSTTDTLQVCTAATASANTCDPGANATNANTVVALVFSIGKNGSVTYDPVANAARPGTGTHELRNLDGNALFVSRPPDPEGFAHGAFDDQMTWIPIGVLYSRMIAAGVLP